jgi:hypothetical protein
VTTYLARSAWTSTAASGPTLTGSKLRGVAVHWPGTSQDAIGDPGQAKIAERLRSYRNFHVNTRGWRDIGYNLAIDQGGRVWMLRSTQWRGNLVGAHCASASNTDANHEYVGVLLLLGQSEQPNAKMIGAFQDWYHNRFLPGWPGRTDVRGHRQVPGAQTNCPGNRAILALDEMTAKPGPTPTPKPPPEDDVQLDAEDFSQIRQIVADELTRDYTHPGPPSTTVATHHGGRYAFLASQDTAKILEELDDLRALHVPLDVDALAAAIIGKLPNGGSGSIDVATVKAGVIEALREGVGMSDE